MISIAKSMSLPLVSDVSGYYCEMEGLSVETAPCAMGYFCTRGASQPNPTDGVTGDVCPMGKYCPVGTHVPFDCPAGTFSNVTGNQDVGDCEPCTPGKSDTNSKAKEIV